MPVTIGVLKETARGENRVAIVPEVASKLAAAGAQVLVERGAGSAARFPDALYKDASFADSAGAVLAAADLLFTVQPPEVAEAIDDYFKSLRPIPSPRLVKGKLSPAAERGRRLFNSDKVGCAGCHKGALFTDQKFHSVGTIGKFDQPTDRFDTPSLIEVWRSGPYLHDGRAATVREVLTTFNRDDEHGSTSKLTRQQIDDLAEYVLSL